MRGFRAFSISAEKLNVFTRKLLANPILRDRLLTEISQRQQGAPHGKFHTKYREVYRVRNFSNRDTYTDTTNLANLSRQEVQPSLPPQDVQKDQSLSTPTRTIASFAGFDPY